jgi:hypothetical protein
MRKKFWNWYCGTMFYEIVRHGQSWGYRWYRIKEMFGIYEDNYVMERSGFDGKWRPSLGHKVLTQRGWVSTGCLTRLDKIFVCHLKP